MDMILLFLELFPNWKIDFRKMFIIKSLNHFLRSRLRKYEELIPSHGNGISRSYILGCSDLILIDLYTK